MVVIVVVFKAIRIIDTHQRTGEGCDLSEGDQQGLMDLSGGFDIDSAEEEHEATDGEDGGGDELYVSVLFHRLFLTQNKISGNGRRWVPCGQTFFKSGAKV